MNKINFEVPSTSCTFIKLLDKRRIHAFLKVINIIYSFKGSWQASRGRSPGDQVQAVGQPQDVPLVRDKTTFLIKELWNLNNPSEELPSPQEPVSIYHFCVAPLLCSYLLKALICINFNKTVFVCIIGIQTFCFLLKIVR